MDEKEWEKETKNPTIKYPDPVNVQTGTNWHGETNSIIEPYN